MVDYRPPHAERAREILKTHPQVRKLFGTNAWSAAVIVGIVSLQFLLAYVLRDYPWWVILLVAYFVGAYAIHGLWVMVHECAHHLIFRNRLVNRVLALVANLPMVVPATVTFCIYHLTHHKYLGDYDHDTDIPSNWEGKLLRGGFLGRLLWQICFPFTQSLRTLRVGPEGRSPSWLRWIVPNYVVQIAFDLAVLYFLGPWALFYLFMSLFFSIGPHPLGARWIQEHYVFADPQETYSYYGMLNLVAFNIGYHNEHHDLPQIPWNRLPKLLAMCPEMYVPLKSHRSWTVLWLRFLFDKELRVFRIARQDRSEYMKQERPDSIPPRPADTTEGSIRVDAVENSAERNPARSEAARMNGSAPTSEASEGVL